MAYEMPAARGCAAGEHLSNTEHGGRKCEIDEQGKEVHDRRDDRGGHHGRVEAKLFCQQRQCGADDLGKADRHGHRRADDKRDEIRHALAL